MVSKLNKDNKGFTIIEVLIVLAIAGLIMLIVFLAIPALQRSQRNTQRKSDASAIVTAINNASTNANGAKITQINSGDGTTASDTSVSFRPNASVTNVETARLGIYRSSSSAITWSSTNVGSIFITDLTSSGTYTPTVVGGSTTATVSHVNINSITIVLGFGCNESGTGINSTNRNPRAVSVIYVAENATDRGNLQCIN
ncbi:type II secretion system protein [Candidatus Saccharibacteria bacterium]|nr:type II secretion system protein [Candidatus Saccharibacteria bacterium]